jgi:hypothetical protein
MEQSEKAKHKRKKAKARIALQNAVRDGIIQKPTGCWECKRKMKILGHHFDYDRPLDVCWMCYECHSRLHGFGFTSYDELRDAGYFHLT